MKKMIIFAFLAAGCATAPPPPSPEPPATVETAPAVDPEAFRAHAPAPAPPRPYDFPEIDRVVLSNGLRLLITRDESAPLVTIRALVRSGADRDPADHAGLATLTADLLDEGAGNRSGIQLAEDLGQLGTTVQTFAGYDASFVSLQVLPRHLEAAAAIFADILLRPTFGRADVEREKKDRLTELLQQRDRAATLADLHFSRIAAHGSPYAIPQLGTEATVNRIDRSDVRRFYSRYYVPNNVSLIVVGNVDPTAVRALVEKHFGSWKRGRDLDPIRATTTMPERSILYLLDRPQSVQSEIRVGHVGVPRASEDYFPLLTMNSMLGGIFSSRLNLNLRERHGYTYGIRSQFFFARNVSPFVVSTAVRNEVTTEAVREILGELSRIRSGDVSEQELADTKNYLMGVFPATVQTSSNLAARVAELEVFELPEDYFEHYRARIAAVTAEDITRVANKYLDPDRAAILIVGKAAEVQQPLSALERPLEIVEP